MQNEIDVKRFEEKMKNQFPEATVEEVLKLAELGKAVLSVDDLVGDTLYVTEQVLKADDSLTRSVQYCLSTMIEAAKIVREYEIQQKS